MQFRWEKYSRNGGKNMKEDEKKPITWEIADPKPPIIHSGHMENKRHNEANN